MGILSAALTLALLAVVPAFYSSSAACPRRSCPSTGYKRMAVCPFEHYPLDEQNKDGRPSNNITAPVLVMKREMPFSFVGNNYREHRGRSVDNMYSASGSGQPSLMELERLRQEWGSLRKVVVVDTRREPHGFFKGARHLGEGHAFYSRCNLNAATRFLSDQDAEQEECLLLQALAQTTDPIEVYREKTLSDSIKLVPGCVLSEKDACDQLNMVYFRLLVPDYSTPRAYDVDRFVDMVKTKDLQKTHFHIHCNAGKGRTATFLFILDVHVRVNASSASALPFDKLIGLGANWSAVNLAKRYSDRDKFLPQQYRLNLLRLFHRYRSEDGKLRGSPASFAEYFQAKTSPYPSLIKIAKTGNCYFANTTHNATHAAYYDEGGNEATIDLKQIESISMVPLPPLVQQPSTPCKWRAKLAE